MHRGARRQGLARPADRPVEVPRRVVLLRRRHREAVRPVVRVRSIGEVHLRDPLSHLLRAGPAADQVRVLLVRSREVRDQVVVRRHRHDHLPEARANQAPVDRRRARKAGVTNNFV